MLQQHLVGTSRKQADPARTLSHEMNNSLNAITLGLHVLAQTDDADIQFVVGELQAEITDLQVLITKLVKTQSPK